MKYLLAILGEIDETIRLEDGDGLQIAVFKHDQKQVLDIFNVRHVEIDDDGARVPVEPINIRIRIERAHSNAPCRILDSEVNQ